MKIKSIKKVKENPDIIEVNYIDDYILFKPIPKTKLVYRFNQYSAIWLFMENGNIFHKGSDVITNVLPHLKLNEEFKIY